MTLFYLQLYLELHYKYQPQCRISVADPIVTRIKSFSCKLCNRKFQDMNTLASHKKEHEKVNKHMSTNKYAVLDYHLYLYR